MAVVLIIIIFNVAPDDVPVRSPAAPTPAVFPVTSPTAASIPSGPPPVALVVSSVINVAAASPANRNNRAGLAILDGTPSGPGLSFQWAQTSGTPLYLSPAAMGKDRVGLYINTPGTYTFSLTVSRNGLSGAPATVTVNVSPAVGSNAAPAQQLPK
jgi:hypothetical protein